MFAVGAFVCYGTQGVCKVSDITVKQIGREKNNYYVLVPVRDERSTIFVPTDNEKLLKNMRPVLTQDEIDEIICSFSQEESNWIANDAERKEFCNSTVKNGDCKQLMRLINMLYLRRKDLKNQKKHIHIIDERYFKEAERLLYDEFSFVLNIAVEQVPEYIASKLNK